MKMSLGSTHKKKGRATALILALSAALTLSAIPVCAGEEEEGLPSSASLMEAIAREAGTKPEELLASDYLVPGDSVSDWIAAECGMMGLGDPSAYLTRAQSYVEDQYAQKGCLDPVKVTSTERMALTVLSLGGDPSAFGKKEDGSAIDLLSDGTWNWSGTDSLGTQGINGWIYALVALDAGGAEVPEGALFTREDMITALLDNETDGAFGLVKGEKDVDLTAMALQALAPYREDKTVYTLSDGSETTVPEAIEAALSYLSGVQLASGDFMSYETANAESTAQVLMALTDLGIDPKTDDRFIKEATIPEALSAYENDNGLISHTIGDGGDVMATEQTLLAVLKTEGKRIGQTGYTAAASDQKDSGEASASDASSGQTAEQTSSAFPVLPVVLIIAAGVIIAATVLLFRKKKA